VDNNNNSNRIKDKDDEDDDDNDDNDDDRKEKLNNRKNTPADRKEFIVNLYKYAMYYDYDETNLSWCKFTFWVNV